MSIGNDELLFSETAEKIKPLLDTVIDLLRSGRISLKAQQYRIDNNHMMIVDLEKKITQEKALIDDANVRAKSIISVAEDRAKEIEKGIQVRMAEINHLEREMKKKSEEVNKLLWETKDKKAIKA